MGRLFWKMFIGFWLTLVITGAAVGIAVYFERVNSDEEFSTDRRSEFLVTMAANAIQFGGKAALDAQFRQWPSARPIDVLVVNAQGVDIYHRPVPPKALQQARVSLATSQPSPSLRKTQDVSGAEYIVFVPAHHKRPGGPLKNRLPPPEMQMLIAFIASLIFSALFAGYMTRPIRHLQHASRKLADGDLNARVSDNMGRRNDELADLGRDFDFMATRLQTLVDSQKQLLHDVSHELRSPVARMRLAAGLAQQQPEKLATALERIERETERLDDLLGQILTLARLDAGLLADSNERICLNELLADIVHDVNFEAQAVGSEVVLQATRDVYMPGSYELLHRAFENVIRNALKYNPAGQTVLVRLYQDESGVHVTVRDHGPGLAESELEAVFEPFYRASTSQGSGFGLGLAIAKRAVLRHQGRILLSNRAEGGLLVEMVFDTAAQASS